MEPVWIGSMIICACPIFSKLPTVLAKAYLVYVFSLIVTIQRFSVLT
jgi:hypothetical protein